MFCFLKTVVRDKGMTCWLCLQPVPLLVQPGAVDFVHDVGEKAQPLGIQQHLGTHDAVHVVESFPLKRQPSSTVSTLCLPSYNTL